MIGDGNRAEEGGADGLPAADEVFRNRRTESETKAAVVLKRLATEKHLQPNGDQLRRAAG